MSSVLKPLGVVCAAVFFCYLALGVALGTIPVFVHVTLGYDNVIVGSVIAAQSLATIFTRGLAGSLIDTRGSKYSLVIGSFVMIAGGLLFAAAAACSQMPALSLTLLFASRLVLGLGESLSVTAALAWGIARVGAPRSGAVMVWVGIALYGAIGLGAPLGAFAVQHTGMTAAGLVATLATVFALLATLPLQKMPIVHGARLSFFKIVGLIAPSGAGLALSALSYSGLVAFVTLLFVAHGWTGATNVLLVFAAAYVGARLFFGHVPDRFGGMRVALASLAIECVGQLLIWRAATPLAVYAGAICTGIGYSMAFPALGVEAMKRIAPQNRGSAMGAFVAFFDLGMGLSGPLNGVIATALGYSAVYAAGAVASAIAGVVVVAGVLRSRASGVMLNPTR